MISYNKIMYELASFDWQDDISQRTGKLFTYTYYIELTKKYRKYELTNDEYYDFEICRFKYDINQKTI